MEPSPLITGASQQAEWTRVIVLAPNSDGDAQAADGATRAIESLLPEFEKRDWFAIVHGDPYLAFAELALRERAQAARAAWGLQRMEGLALVIVDPEQWPAPLLDDLRQAVRRSLPAASVWTASGDRIEAAEGPLPETSKPERMTMSGHRLGLQQPSELHPQRARTAASSVNDNCPVESADDAVASDHAGVRDAGRLSRDEIDMLLHDSELDNEVPGGRGAGS